MIAHTSWFALPVESVSQVSQLPWPYIQACCAVLLLCPKLSRKCWRLSWLSCNWKVFARTMWDSFGETRCSFWGSVAMLGTTCSMWSHQCCDQWVEKIHPKPMTSFAAVVLRSFKSLRDCSVPFCSWMCLQSDATLCNTHWLWQQIDHVPPGNSFNINGIEMHCSNSRFVQAVAWLAEKAGANTSVWKERHGPWFVQKMQCNYKRASKAEADECKANPFHRCDKNTDWMWWSES